MFFARHRSTSLLTIAALAGLAGCGRAPEPPTARATQPQPDARLAAVYERACVHCHETPASGAPQRGDRTAWGPRERTGLGALVASVRQGKGSMPPMGWCPECSDADFAVLVTHLAAAVETTR